MFETQKVAAAHGTSLALQDPQNREEEQVVYTIDWGTDEQGHYIYP